jgi:hypothetical protein
MVPRWNHNNLVVVHPQMNHNMLGRWVTKSKRIEFNMNVHIFGE